MCGPHHSHNMRDQDCAEMLFPTDLTFPFHAVACVVGNCSELKVPWIHVERDIRFMSNDQPFRNRSVEDLIGDTVSWLVPSVSAKPAVSVALVDVSRPYPGDTFGRRIAWHVEAEGFFFGAEQSSFVGCAVSFPSGDVHSAPSAIGDRLVAFFDAAGRLRHVDSLGRPCPRSVTSTRGGFSLPTVSVDTDNSAYRTSGDA